MLEKQHQDECASENGENLFSSPPPENSSVAQTRSDDEHARLLQAWLDFPTAREQRRFLEGHCDLLDAQSGSILHDLLVQAREGSEQAKRLREAFMLLQDARARGKTAQAVREAYVNIHGGFVLDLPPWLEATGQRLIELRNEKSLEETAEARVALLQEALEQIQESTAYAPELLATLRRELADAWTLHPRADRIQALETAIGIYESVLETYTLTCYPYQYARAQNNLGRVYLDRVAGERRENLERAISCIHEALRVHTFDAFPFEYARAQNNLGFVYLNRVAGERRENLEQTIACFREASHVWTLETLPFYYAGVQNNLGIAYRNRIAGERQENLEQALACYREASRVHTLEAFPFEYARVQNNLGVAYGDRIMGERRKNLEQAVACYQEALRVHTLEAFPFEYAEVQDNLGNTYTQRIVGGKLENLERAISCYQEALLVYTIEAFPRESRNVRLRLAETEAQRGNWNAVQEAYTAALEAEDLLVILGTGTLGRDAVLKEGRGAPIRLGYTLQRLGYIAEAAIAMERGRARGLAEAMAFDAANPARIADEERRARYTIVREALIAAQANLHALASQDLDEDMRRRLDLERTAAYRQAKAAFDELVSEIRAAHDPDDFLNTSLDATTILQAATRVGSGHGLVYLAATPWGGVAVTALAAQPQGSTSARFVALDLPDLTETWVNTLIEARLKDGSERFIGGFTLAQMSEGFEQLQTQWAGETFQAKVKALRAACRKTKQESTLASAAKEAMTLRPFARLARQPLASLNREDKSLLSTTFDQIFLKLELDRCLELLGTTVIHPLVSWLREQGASSLTLIPCGHLATFPLTNVILPDGRSVAETLPTSIAPSARSLLSNVGTRNIQAGVYALGNPENNLEWSEAEALTLTALARSFALPAEAHIKHQATRERLLAALGSRWIVDASCHGSFDLQDFLRSALRLAKNGRITMSEMLNHQADLRGLRLLLLSACQTALLDLQGARDEAHSLAAAMLQAGAQAVLASQWPVDDKATYLLMVRFAQEWLPHLEQEPPAAALARAQAWLRRVTNAELANWQRTMPTPPGMKQSLTRTDSSTRQAGQTTTRKPARRWQRISVRGQHARYLEDEAQLAIRLGAEDLDPAARPYADPYYWAGFQVIGC